MRNEMKSGIAILISAVTIFLIFKITKVSFSIVDVVKLNPFFILLALIHQISFWFLWAFRLKMITESLGKKLSFLFSLETTLSSMFFAAITPSSAGGEPVRAKLIGSKCGSYGLSTAVVLIERLLDAIFFAIALPIFLIFTDFAVGFGLKVATLFSAFLILFITMIYALFKDPKKIKTLIIYFNKKFLKKFIGERGDSITGKLIKEAESFRMALIEFSKVEIGRSSLIVFITVLMWIIGFLIPSYILLAMKNEPHFLLSITSQLIIVVVSLIPLTPGSSGIAEVSMAYLYSNFVPKSVLGVLVAIWRVVTYYTNLLFGFFVTFRLFNTNKLG